MRRYLAISLSLLILVLLISVAYSANVVASLGNFNITNADPNVNWTNSSVVNVTLGVNSSTYTTLNFTIRNDTATVKANYTQDVTSAVCGSGTSGIEIVVQNRTTSLTNVTTFLINNNSIANVTLLPQVNCPAGKYYGSINVTNGSEWGLINMTYNIPINVTNSTGTGYFLGAFAVNATYYHSYYFNTTATTNATSVYVNLTWSNSSTADPDIFLLDENGNLLAKSINKLGNEALFYSFTTANKMYEVRVYGNSTSAISYLSGTAVVLSAVNVTNTSDNTRLSQIDYGKLNITNSTNMTNVTLRNDGYLNYTSNLTETKEFYHIINYSDTNSKNFSFIQPGSDIATRVRVILNYSGGGNFTLRLWSPSGSLSDSSFTKRFNANFTGLETEEYVEVSSPTNGLWTAEVVNNTAASGSYNLTIRTYLNSSLYVRTNFTSAPMNSTQFTGNQTTFHINFTVPNNTLEGVHEGFLHYSSGSVEVAKLKLIANITAPVLSVNRSMNTSSHVFHNNIGFNATGSGTVNITINNTGSKTLTITNNTTSSKLYLTSDSSKFIDFNFSYPSTVAAGSSDNITLNYTLNTSATGNTVGLYSGWLLLNTSDAVPYKTFNMSIHVNLTNKLNVSVTSIFLNNYLSNASKDYNVSSEMTVSYINNTVTSGRITPHFTSISNITEAYIVSDNVTSYRYPTSGSLTYGNYTADLDPTDDLYRVNVTVPSGLPGGNYTLIFSTTHSVNGVVLTGSGSNNTLYINNTGVHLQANSSAISATGATTAYFNVSAKNYGNVKATGAITAATSNSNIATVETDTVFKHGGSAGECGSFSSTDIDALSAETCIYQFKVTVKNTTGSSTLTFTHSNANYGNLTTTVSVSVSSGTTSNSSNNQNTNSTPTPSNQYKMKLLIPEKVEIVQGTQKSSAVDVNNTGSADLSTLTLSISGINSSWYSSTPASFATVGVGFIKTFNVIYTVPSDAAVKDYIVIVKGSATNASDEKNFTLRVLPSEATKNMTNATIANVSQELKNLEEEVEDLDDENLTVKLSSIKSLLSEAQNLVAQGDHFGALQKVDQAKSLMNELRSLVSAAQDSDASSGGLKIVYIILGVIAVLGIGFLVYMLIPPKEGYHPEKGFRYVRNEDKAAHLATKSAVKGIAGRLKSFFIKKE